MPDLSRADFPIMARSRPSPLAGFLNGAQECNALLDCADPVLGIDASVAKVGFAVAWHGHLKSWVWEPKSKGVARMAEAREEMAAVIHRYGITRAVIEAYSFGSKFSRAHATGEIGGILRLACLDAKVTLSEVPPNSLKLFLSGKGNTPKTGMPLALYKRYGVDYANEDQADAAALALLGAAHFGGHDEKIQKFQEDALKKVTVVCAF